MPTIDYTLGFVTSAHAGQVDKAGQPYIHHLTRVLDRTIALARMYNVEVTVEMRHAALLHDLLEDTEFTADELLVKGYSALTVQFVQQVTRGDKGVYAPVGVTYREMIGQLVVRGMVGSLVIKLADIQDHLQDTSAIPSSLGRRYMDAHHRLHVGLEDRWRPEAEGLRADG